MLRSFWAAEQSSTGGGKRAARTASLSSTAAPSSRARAAASVLLPVPGSPAITISTLASRVHDPDPGIHATMDWLLRHGTGRTSAHWNWAADPPGPPARLWPVRALAAEES